MKLFNEIDNILKNAGMKLFEDSYEDDRIFEIIHKIKKMKNANEEREILSLGLEIYKLIDELPSFNIFEEKLHSLNDWLYTQIKKFSEENYPNVNFNLSGEDFLRLAMKYHNTTKMYCGLLKEYLPRLELHFVDETDYNDYEENNYEGDDTELDERYVQRTSKHPVYGTEYNDDYIEFEPEMKLIDENDVDWVVVEVNNDKVLLLSDNNEFQVITQDDLNLEIDMEKWKCLYDDRFFSKDDYKRVTGKDFLKEDDEENVDENQEIYDNLDSELQAIIDVVNLLDETDNYREKEGYVETLYDNCINYGGEYEEKAEEFERVLFESALEDDDNMQYSRPDPSDIDYDRLSDQFYNSFDDYFITYFNKYYSYSLGSVFDEIQDYCEKYFREEQEENDISDTPKIDMMTYNDVSTIDESFDPSLSENQELIEIYEFVTTTDPHRCTDSEGYNLFNKCMNCEYDELESYIQGIEDEIRDGYVYDDENTEEVYDGDATYEYCSDIPMSQKISYYASSSEINDFNNKIKELIEEDTDYKFPYSEEKNNEREIYDGSEDELDESVKKEDSPLDKLVKIHKEHPTTDIRDIAKKITNGNIEEYISLMKQYYEKFEK